MQPSIAPLRGTVPRLWEENHDFYHSSWKSMRLLVHLDLGASEVAPLRSHPQRLQARIAMRAPCPDGLRSPAEAEPLFALEDLLSSHLRREVGALYVGRIIGGGELTLVWYMPSMVEKAEETETLSETLSTLVSELAGGYQIRLSQTHDPAWTLYFDFLFPDVYNLQVMLNRRRLLVLEDHGDDGARPRQVDHQARFPTLEQAEAARRALSALGYDVDDPELDPELDPETDPETDPELPQLLGSGLRSGSGSGLRSGSGSGLRSGSGSGLRSGPTVGRSPELGAPMSACGDCCTGGERNSRGDSGVGGCCDVGGGVPWLLTFGRWDSLSDGRIDTICTELLDVILPSSGHYEGWGAEIGSGLGGPP